MAQAFTAMRDTAYGLGYTTMNLCRQLILTLHILGGRFTTRVSRRCRPEFDMVCHSGLRSGITSRRAGRRTSHFQAHQLRARPSRLQQHTHELMQRKMTVFLTRVQHPSWCERNLSYKRGGFQNGCLAVAKSCRRIIAPRSGWSWKS